MNLLLFAAEGGGNGQLIEAFKHNPTFMVLNLFIGVVVNAMQEEASKADAEEREVEREMIQEEAAPILAEVRSLRTEVAQLRTELAGWRTQASG